MAKLIGTNTHNNYGEDLFISKALEYLDDSNIIYWNRQLFGREFDVCILMPDKGILVVELKGWREENIVRIENSDTIIVRTADGEIPAAPQKQARGYRFSIERYIRQNIGKFPLVFQMVGLPQISRAFYKEHRLDIVAEERFTFVKEDFENKAAFFKKIDEALREASFWNRDSFDHKTMLEVRNLFETGIQLDPEDSAEIAPEDTIDYHQHDYSRFYYFNTTCEITEQCLSEMMAQYFSGCKLYGVFSTKEQMHQVIDALDLALHGHGLLRNKDDIEIIFEPDNTPVKSNSKDSTAFMAFHCALSLLVSPCEQCTESFCIRNGCCSESQHELLYELSRLSQFNADQYFVEHASPEKHIVIRAGAGTGKTYTMIARIAYICYSQNISLPQMADRIVMITFTNEAADQMEEKLKRYFRNCYLITSKVEYLQMVSKIDHMQISTIHSYAKEIIAKLGTSFGYGIDLSITSSQFFRKKKISDVIDSYVAQRTRELGPNYPQTLGMPIYAIRDSILDFIEKLHNKSVDIESIQASNFGSLLPDDTHCELHKLLASVIPTVEREYFSELLENNKVHLSTMMSLLNQFISAPKSKSRIMDLKKDKYAQQFMFVDEFQDTDDVQIESLLTISRLLNYKLFLVGDIKQCIYRFRGAKEKAFDQLHMNESPDDWLEFSLQRNYRTDAALLEIFDRSFSKWGARSDELLSYTPQQDRLLGTRNYNDYLIAHPEKFFRKITATNDDLRIPMLVGEIKRIQSRIEYEEAHGTHLSAKEKSIAILVRENWQADLIRNDCARLNIIVETNTGGDLYMSQPALDMMTLVNALVHFDEADYLYNLLTSNFFDINLPKSNLYQIRSSIREGAWRAKTDEREQVNYLIQFINVKLANAISAENKWEYVIKSLRTKPILQAIRELYSLFEPWNNYSDEPARQHYYQLNVDLLFEQLINACNIDKLTINTLQEHLYNCIVSHVAVDSRVPDSLSNEPSIQCITVHKSKGLEYGHVIMPFCSAPIESIKKAQLHVSTVHANNELQIGYSLSVGESGITVQNNFYDEAIEKSEKAREETRILYVAMTRAIRSFSWIELQGKQSLSWQNLIETES